jgi:hypothetical protein
LLLDLQAHDPPLQLVDRRRHRVDLHLQPRRRLVDEINRLVRQEPIGNVAIRQPCRRQQRRVPNANAVVNFVFFLDAAQDRHRIFHRRLTNEHRLKPSLQRLVLLDVLAILVERRCPHAAQLATRQRRLEHVGRVLRPLRRTRTDQRMKLVDKQDHLPRRLRHFLEQRLQPILKLTAIFGSSDESTQIQRQNSLVAQALGNVAADDPLGNALDDGGLADAWLADQHRVVLGPTRQHLNRPPDFLVAANHRIELAFARQLRDIPGVALQRLVLALGVLVGDAL